MSMWDIPREGEDLSGVWIRIQVAMGTLTDWWIRQGSLDSVRDGVDALDRAMGLLDAQRSVLLGMVDRRRQIQLRQMHATLADRLGQPCLHDQDARHNSRSDLPPLLVGCRCPLPCCASERQAMVTHLAATDLPVESVLGPVTSRAGDAIQEEGSTGMPAAAPPSPAGADPAGSAAQDAGVALPAPGPTEDEVAAASGQLPGTDFRQAMAEQLRSMGLMGGEPGGEAPAAPTAGLNVPAAEPAPAGLPRRTPGASWLTQTSGGPLPPAYVVSSSHPLTDVFD